mgnify:CR=1 FL=1
MKTLPCAHCQHAMEPVEREKTVSFRGEDVAVRAVCYVCPDCGLEAGTPASAGAMQRAVSDAYRRKAGLLCGEEIRALRKARGFSQQELADAMGVGVASIKRWERGLIQNRAMDRALRTLLKAEDGDVAHTGGRSLSLPRIKLVLTDLEKRLGKRLLEKDDRVLYAAAYLWYADMLAFARLKRGMTGATYAALPHGPQLNNFRDLIGPIREADPAQAEPLSEEEARILQHIADAFPREPMAHEAAHRERVWEETPIGASISYLRAREVEGIPL